MIGRVDQNIITYMVGHLSKKWWLLIFLFCLDLSANNAYQIYHYQEPSAGKKLEK